MRTMNILTFRQLNSIVTIHVSTLNSWETQLYERVYFSNFQKNIGRELLNLLEGKREFPIYGVAVGQRTKFQTKERNHRKRPIAVVVGDQKPDAARAKRYTITTLIRRSEPLRSLFGS